MTGLGRLAGLFLLAFGLVAMGSQAQATPPSTPITLDLALSQRPVLNRSVTVTITLKSTQNAGSTDVELVLPEGARASRDKWTVNLGANSNVRLTATVTLTRPGNVAITAQATSPQGDDTVWGDAKSIPLHLTAGRNATPAQLGWAVTQVPVAQQSERGNARIVSMAPTGFDFATQQRQRRVVEPSAKPARTTQEAAEIPTPRAGTTLNGVWRVLGRNNVFRGIDQQLVEVRKGDGSTLATRIFCFTDPAGSFSCNVPAHPGTTFRVLVWSWMNFSHSSGMDRLGVFDGPETTGGCNSDSVDCAYPVQSGEIICADGGTCNVGTWDVNAGVGEPWLGAHRMTRDLISSWKKLYFDVGFGAAAANQHGAGTPGPARIDYPVPTGHGTHAHVPPRDGWLSVEPPNQNSAHVVVHEYGHVVMANLWDGKTPAWPTADCPSPHFINAVGGAGCALYEGWANFWTWYSLNDPVFTWPSGATSNLQTRQGYSAGDKVEGNVAAVLGDWFDAGGLEGPSTGPADYLKQGVKHIWHTLSSQSDSNFAQFWAAFSGDTAHSRCFALDGAKYNTVNYSKPGCSYFSVTLSRSPALGGTVSGAGTQIMTGRSWTVKATPKTGYKFVKWTENGVKVSTVASFTFKVTKNRNLVAVFAKTRAELLEVSDAGAGVE